MQLVEAKLAPLPQALEHAESVPSDRVDLQADLHALLAAKMMRSRAALPPEDLRGRVCLKRAVVMEKECLSSDLACTTRGHF